MYAVSVSPPMKMQPALVNEETEHGMMLRWMTTGSAVKQSSVQCRAAAIAEKGRST